MVALLTIEHQVRVQNWITRVSWDTRTALHEAEKRGQPGPKELSDVERLAEPLVQALLFADQAKLAGPVAGASSFADEFVAKGPSDEKGRSLRQFDLRERLFRYPLSYLIYSESFGALPGLTRKYVARRLREELAGSTDLDRRTALEILEATRPLLMKGSPP